MRDFGKLLPVVKYQNVEGAFQTVSRLAYDNLRELVAIEPTSVQHNGINILQSACGRRSVYLFQRFSD